MQSDNLIHYTACPSCGSSDLSTALTAEDHTVSHLEFAIVECAECRLRFTQDVPDAASIGRYYRSENYISHSDTSKGLVNRLYHLIRRQTLSDKRHLLEAATRQKKGRLLDIGAGTGAFAKHMQEAGWEVTGLEPDEEARQRAGDLYGISLLPAEDLRMMPADHFDAITLWHVLEHVHALHDYLEQLKKILKRGGRVFIAVPNYTSFDAAYYKSSWAAYDVPRHLYHFCPDAMVRLLDQHDLMLQVTRPMWYDSFYISMLSDKYGHRRGNMLRAVLVGAFSNLRAFVDKSKCSSVIYVAGKS
ncbi:MAG: class I SAM-dependent methyltransferase [Bacteroidota bacterium]|nr:class I SAM-dependent methyltransferase [Bacteroidota bacterium]MDP4217682.1 class I SAM-dependent methyltransferase [Bacteroidota bacterium]MDP4248421.1 class I SAM-dependent methyltransferase [Bacteroidota bacterium]MDP4255153.1 class I SAM-dependent methyltransferase [Bacteroidota bacterium]MDP4260179.1 class I SAM-dependent methyltransferase [Bacteroidota bacterium]